MCFILKSKFNSLIKQTVAH